MGIQTSDNSKCKSGVRAQNELHDKYCEYRGARQLTVKYIQVMFETFDQTQVRQKSHVVKRVR